MEYSKKKETFIPIYYSDISVLKGELARDHADQHKIHAHITLNTQVHNYCCMKHSKVVLCKNRSINTCQLLLTTLLYAVIFSLYNNIDFVD